MSNIVRYNPSTFNLIPSGLHTATYKTGYYSLPANFNVTNNAANNTPYAPLASPVELALLPPHPDITINGQSEFVIGKSGIYSINADSQWDTNATGLRQISLVRTITNDPTRLLLVNGEGSLASVAAITGAPTALATNYTAYFEAGEKFAVRVIQTSGANLFLTPVTQPSTGAIGTDMRVTSVHYN